MRIYQYDDIQRQGISSYTPEISENRGSSLGPFLFVCVVIALVGYGLVTLYSASYDEALQHGLPSAYYFIRQTLFALLGFGAFIVIRFIPVRWIQKAILWFLSLSLILMVVTLTTRFGVERLGARRWLQIGPLPSFQPSELLKVSMVLFLSRIMALRKKHEEKSLWLLLVALGVIIIASLLIVLQRDYSTTLVFLLVALALLLAAGIKFRYIGIFALGITVIAIIFLLTEPYRIKRVVSFLFPSIDPTGLNWQVQNSLKAIGSGGILGKGLGNGVFKLGVIPEVQSDFIFASLAEEMGFLGVLVFFVLFVVFAVLGFSTAYRHGKQGNTFLAYTSFGISFMIVWQALVNLAVVTSLLPPTGIPLPFFSQGGTNLFMILAECGLLYKCMITEREESTHHG